MKRIVSCICIISLAVSLTFCLTVMVSTEAEAASSVEEARQKILQEDRKKEEEAHRAAEARSAEILRKAKAAGSEFIAFSESAMNWEAAKAYCRKHGGKLPRINNSNSWDGKNPPARGILIDGFGYGDRPWDEVGVWLPGGNGYWTGTAVTGSKGYWWFVQTGRSTVSVNEDDIRRGDGYQVVCVP